MSKQCRTMKPTISKKEAKKQLANAVITFESADDEHSLSLSDVKPFEELAKKLGIITSHNYQTLVAYAYEHPFQITFKLMHDFEHYFNDEIRRIYDDDIDFDHY